MLVTLASHIITGADGLGRHSKLMVKCGVDTISCASYRISLYRVHTSIKAYLLEAIKIWRMTKNSYEWLKTINNPHLSLLTLWKIGLFSLNRILDAKFLAQCSSRWMFAITQMNHYGRLNSPTLRECEKKLLVQVSSLRDLITSYEISLCFVEGFLSIVSIVHVIQNRENQSNIRFALNLTIGFLNLFKCLLLFYPLLEALVEVLLFWINILVRFVP